jgi:hypothetical protein
VILVYLRPASSSWLDAVVQVLNNVIHPVLQSLDLFLEKQRCEVSPEKSINSGDPASGVEKLEQFLPQLLLEIASDPLLLPHD